MTPANVAARLQAWEDSGFARRLWAKDHTLWSPTPLPELADRLGWLDLPTAMTDQTAAITDFAYALKAAGIRHIVLLGMGGSSLAPEVFQRTCGNAAGYPALIVLDSTHPGAVAAVDAAIDLRTTTFLVSSKSCTTTETLSLFRYFWRRVAQRSTPGRTLSPSPIRIRRWSARRERGPGTCFAPPDVGGRCSALTVFDSYPLR
jgi:transaldolase/glucose-6-phosphate isomerase